VGAVVFAIVAFIPPVGFAQNSSSAPSSSSASSAKSIKKPAKTGQSDIDPGTVTNGIYRNKSLQFSYKIPDGWVLRTDEMNARDADASAGVNQGSSATQKQSPPGSQGETEEKARVLLAAFSRPPEARGEDVNSSIVIAAESVATYPGLT